MSDNGKYIVVEGLDGSGKTTQLKRILEYFGDGAIGVREPGDTPMNEGIRTLLKDKNIPRTAYTNLFLFSAARVDLIDTVIRPAITNGKNVISDRNWLSSVAYQSAENIDAGRIIELSKIAAREFFEPDLTILIDADPATCLARLKTRGGSEADYFETKGGAYLIRVRESYLREIVRIKNAVVIDGTPTPDEVWEQIQQALDNLGMKKK